MAIFGVSIEKECDYRGGVERYSNVYFYQTEEAEIFDDSQAIQELVDAEAACMASDARFVLGRSWGPVEQGPVASVMRAELELAGTGTLSNTAAMSPERAVMIRWPAGRSQVTGQPVYLRKWIHNPGAPTSGAWSDAIIGEAQQLTQNLTDLFVTYANAVTNIGGASGDAYQLVSSSGRLPEQPPEVFAFLEHRNFH